MIRQWKSRWLSGANCHAVLIATAALWFGTLEARADDPPELKAALASVTVEELKKHVEFLASDTLQGREAGTVGNHAAGTYLVTELKKSALKPMGDGGEWFQYFNGNMRNILGVLPGSDESLKNEWVLVGGHYDHVGFGAPNNSRGPIGYVHNGADDNASGTTALLEVIEALSESKLPLRRTVLFAFWDGEEKGLLGSRHFAANPKRPLDQLKLVLTADMLGRLRESGLEITGWRTGFGLRQWVTRQNAESLRIDFNLRYVPESDHWPFFERGVPSIMLHTGKHDDYHRPSDDAELINVKGLQKVTQTLLRMTVAAANADSLPLFRDAAREELPELNALAKLGPPARPLTPRPARLGVSFDPELEAKHIVKVVSVQPAGPADRAGIKVGDEIVEFGGRRLSDGVEFGAIVLAAPQEVEAKIKRGDENLSLKVKLNGEPVRVGLTLKRDTAEPGSAIVAGIVESSEAHRRGLQIGDRILAIGGKPVSSMPETADIGEQLASPMSPVEVQIEREGRLETILFPPAEKPSAATSSGE